MWLGVISVIAGLEKSEQQKMESGISKSEVAVRRAASRRDDNDNAAAAAHHHHREPQQSLLPSVCLQAHPLQGPLFAIVH